MYHEETKEYFKQEAQLYRILGGPEREGDPKMGDGRWEDGGGGME